MPSSSEAQEAEIPAQDYMVVEFIEGMSPRSHPTFPGGLTYDFGKARWKRPELSPEIDIKQVYSKSVDANGSLVAAVNAYLRKNGQESLDLSTQGTWSALRSGMDRTSVAVQWALENRRDTSSFAGKIRKAMGILCESASVGKVFTSVIPNDLNLASAVCGGLNVVFSAMEQKAVHERSIRDAMEELPLILRTHEPFAEAATRDLRIHQETDALYVAVCQVLQHIIEWLIENSIKSTVKHLFTPKRYAEKLGEAMAKVRCAAQGLDACATAIIVRTQKESLDLQSRSLLLQEQIFLAQEDTGLHMRNLDTNIQQNLEAQDARLQRFEQIQSFQLRIQMELASAIACANLQPFLRDRYQGLYTAKKKASLREEQEFSVEDILTHTKFDASLVDNDVAQFLRLQSSPLQHKLHSDRIQAIQASARLQAWLFVDKSAVLQVNSNTETITDQSGSFVMAKLVSSLVEQARHPTARLEIVPLSFFCGQHSNSYADPMATATALAESVLLQLLDRYRDFNAADLRECWENMRKRTIEDTMWAFGGLVDCLPAEIMLFLVIDGIETFQTPPQRKQETKKVLQRLVDIFRRHHKFGAIIKFLFSTTTACYLMEGLLNEEEVITVAKTPRPGGPSDRVMRTMLL